MREEPSPQLTTQKGPAVLMEPHCTGWEQPDLNIVYGLLLLCFLNLKQNLILSGKAGGLGRGQETGER